MGSVLFGDNIYSSDPFGGPINMLKGTGNSSTSVVSDPVNVDTVADDRAWAEQQAQKQMDYQTEMSNTSWQRAVADMKAAGLNPALAYSQGGASSPLGSSAYTASTNTGLLQTNLNNATSVKNVNSQNITKILAPILVSAAAALLAL